MITATIIQKVKIKRAGVYHSTIDLIDDQTGELIVFIERDHPKRTRQAVTKASLSEAYEIAEELGYEVSSVKSNESYDDDDE